MSVAAVQPKLEIDGHVVRCYGLGTVDLQALFNSINSHPEVTEVKPLTGTVKIPHGVTCIEIIHSAKNVDALAKSLWGSQSITDKSEDEFLQVRDPKSKQIIKADVQHVIIRFDDNYSHRLPSH